MYPLIKDCLVAFLDSIERQVKSGKVDIDMKPQFSYLTLDVIATCAFATKNQPG